MLQCSSELRTSSSAGADPAFRRDVLKGLIARPRTIPPRWFYDHKGSELFEAITALPEYYLTRTERLLLSNAAGEIAALTGPARVVVENKPRLGFFPGSTIGNFRVPDAVDLLRAMAVTLGSGSMLLIGIDRLKDADVLVSAYDDSQGITAAFNLNLLHRINRELGGSVPVDAFRHVARWNDPEARIEMHLEAVRDVRFDVDGRRFSMARGETIHTENSLKYGPRDALVLLRAGGWIPIADWTDEDELFSLILAKAGAAPSPRSTNV